MTNTEIQCKILADLETNLLFALLDQQCHPDTPMVTGITGYAVNCERLHVRLLLFRYLRGIYVKTMESENLAIMTYDMTREQCHK